MDIFRELASQCGYPICHELSVIGIKGRLTHPLGKSVHSYMTHLKAVVYHLELIHRYMFR